MNANFTTGQKYKTKVDGAIVEATFVKMYRDSLVMSYPGRPDFLRTQSAIEKLNSHQIAASISQPSDPLIQAAPAAIVPAMPYFGVNERFGFIDRMVDMVVRGHEKSFVVTGSGGVGKTHTVLNRLKLNELGEGDYTKIMGHMTPKALYSTLFHNADKLCVFDDCDSVINNETSMNLLKAALDSYGTRTVHWCISVDRESDLPSNFDFTGKVIFISNYSLKDIPQPLVSRALYVDVTMTPAEKIERIRAIAPALAPALTESEREDCLRLLEELRDIISDLNFRTLIKVASMRKAQPAQWRNMAAYMVTAPLARMR